MREHYGPDMVKFWAEDFNHKRKGNIDLEKVKREAEEEGYEVFGNIFDKTSKTDKESE